jgi:hypothetical protein
MQQGNKVCSREDERRAFVVYLFYGAHRFREDFEAIVQSLETASDKAKVAEKTPIVVKEFAGADVPFDERGEEWIRRAAFSHSSRVRIANAMPPTGETEPHSPSYNQLTAFQRSLPWLAFWCRFHGFVARP